MPKCKECGKDEWVIVAHQGAMERWRCGFCAWETDVHVYEATMNPQVPAEEGEVFLIHAVWESTPGRAEVKSFLSIFPRLNKSSSSDIVRLIRLGQPIEVGRFSELELRALEPRLRSMNIELIKNIDP